MTIRREPTYLSTEVWRALWLIAKTMPSANGNVSTPDEAADSLLHDVIEERFPEIFPHLKATEKRDADLIKKISKIEAAK